MVRATIILSVVAALIATVSAIPAPKGSLVDIDGGDYIGTGDINAQGALTDVVNANDLHAHDLVQNVDVADDDEYENGSTMMAGSGRRRLGRVDTGSGVDVHNCNGGCHHHDGLLGNLLKREETKKVAKMMKGKKVMMRKKMARKN